MTEESKKSMLSSITDETNDQVLSIYLGMAKDAILSRLYPYGFTSDEDIPEVYDMKHVNIAAFLLNKRGAEGERSHKENGVDRTYGVNGIPNALMAGIVPFAQTPSQED